MPKYNLADANELLALPEIERQFIASIVDSGITPPEHPIADACTKPKAFPRAVNSPSPKKLAGLKCPASFRLSVEVDVLFYRKLIGNR